MATITAIWTAVKLIFTSGVLWKTLLAGIGSTALAIVMNKEVQSYALQLVVSLQMNTEMSVLQKTEAFNKQMLAFLKEKNIVSASGIVNFLREMAYQSMTILLSKEDLATTAASLGAKAYKPVEEVKA